MRGAVAWRIVRSRGLTMLALGVVAFALLQAAPGDPAGILLRASGGEPTPAELQTKVLNINFYLIFKWKNSEFQIETSEIQKSERFQNLQ